MSQLPYYSAQGDEVALFELAHQQKLPLIIKGPTGTGKTRFVEHMAARLQLPLYTVACHDDLTSADLVGRHLIGHEGTYWQDGPLARAVREGGICYLDEVVEARKDTTVVLHPLADDRRELPLDKTGELIKAADNFMLVVSYNPGYQNLLKGLKPSTRQRFLAIHLDYPAPELEREIVGQEASLDPYRAGQLVALAGAIRQLDQQDLEEVSSTRLLIYAGRLMAAGMSEKRACEAAIVQALSDDPLTQSALRDLVELHFD